jgi:Undecaprenyl-phosphate glucose phosphotransferase
MSTFDVRDMMKLSGSVGSTEESAQVETLIRRLGVDQRRGSWSPMMISGLVRLADFGVILLVGAAIYALYVHAVVGWQDLYFFAAPGIAAATVFAYQALHLYQLGAMRAFAPQALRLFGGWSMVFLGVLAVLFFLKAGESISRVWLLSFYLVGMGALALNRIALTIALRRMTDAGRLDRLAAIVGGGQPAEDLIKAIEAQRDAGVRIIGVFDDRRDDRSPDTAAGCPKLGGVDDLVAFARRAKLDLIIFTLPISAEERLLHMLRKLWVLPIDIRLSAHMSKLRFRPHSYSYIGAVPVLDVFDKPIADWDMVLKMAFDRVVGALALIALSPVMLLTALAVKLDSKGPVLFRQKRYGFNNELIEVFKFRSMHVDRADAGASKLVTKDDPRVTRVGRFIRRTSLDELPQLFNVVFFGNLSLVGPRPHALQAKADNQLYDEVVDGYFARHKVKPGITGWAQINGWRGETDTQEKIQRRVEHDLYYIENWSVLFDLYILARTPVSLLTKSENAY